MSVTEIEKPAVQVTLPIQVNAITIVEDVGTSWAVARLVGKKKPEWHAEKWITDRDALIHQLNMDVLKPRCEHRHDTTWVCKRDCGEFCESFSTEALEQLRKLPKRYPTQRGQRT